MNIKPEWLGITEQQFNIFKTIYELNIKKNKSKAKDILVEYKTQLHTDIKRQNLFIQLKALVEKGLITRDSEYSYIILHNDIEDILRKNKELKQNEIQEFDQFLTDFKGQLNSLLNIPKVSFLNTDIYMDVLSNLINTSSTMYADSPFPNLSYSQSFYKMIHRREFIEAMKLNCFKLKKLKIFYLTNLTIDLSFRRSMKLFNSPTRAYKECNTAIDKLEQQVKNFTNLEVRYLEILPGPHMYIFENGSPKDVILSLRGSNIAKGLVEPKGFPDPYGGIHIISNSIGKEAKDVFLNSFKVATPLKGKKGKLLFKATRENLNKLYNLTKK